jgi:hypothetical protein
VAWPAAMQPISATSQAARTIFLCWKHQRANPANALSSFTLGLGPEASDLGDVTSRRSAAS